MKIPVMPILNTGYISHVLKSNYLINSDVEFNSVFTRSGRAAIHLALKLEGIGEGDEVLMPAYHCPSMVEAILDAGAIPRYYRINEDLSVNLNSILETYDPKCTKACLIAHYFGIPQKDLLKIKEICDEVGMVLIEDCAHLAFYKLYNGDVGRVGDYVVLSLRKFFPIYEGGMLLGKKKLGKLSNHIKWDIKCLYNTLHESVLYGRLPLISPLIKSMEKVKGIRKSDVEGIDKDRCKQVLQNGSIYKSEDALLESMSRLSKWILKAVDPEEIKRKRKQNCNRILGELNHVKNFESLISATNVEIVPYKIPILVENSKNVYRLLRSSGYPVWCWDDLRTDICPISNTIGKSIIQIPCHQDLKNDEIEKLCTGLIKAL